MKKYDLPYHLTLTGWGSLVRAQSESSNIKETASNQRLARFFHFIDWTANIGDRVSVYDTEAALYSIHEVLQKREQRN